MNRSGTAERLTHVPPRQPERLYNTTLLRALFALAPDGRQQVDFASRVGLHPVTVNKVLRARSKATEEITKALADWFNLPEEAFFADTDLDINILIRGHNVDYVAV